MWNRPRERLGSCPVIRLYGQVALAIDGQRHVKFVDGSVWIVLWLTYLRAWERGRWRER
jgi:hypothetical protein